MAGRRDVALMPFGMVLRRRLHAYLQIRSHNGITLQALPVVSFLVEHPLVARQAIPSSQKDDPDPIRSEGVKRRLTRRGDPEESARCWMYPGSLRKQMKIHPRRLQDSVVIPSKTLKGASARDRVDPNVVLLESEEQEVRRAANARNDQSR